MYISKQLKLYVSFRVVRIHLYLVNYTIYLAGALEVCIKVLANYKLFKKPSEPLGTE